MRFVYVIIFLVYLTFIPVFPQGAQSRPDQAPGDSSSISDQMDSLKIRSLDSTVQIINDMDLDDSTASQLLTMKNNIYTASMNGIVYCINPQGKINWEYHTDGKVRNSVIGTGDLVVAMTEAGDLFTINANNGDPVQAIGIGEHINSDILFIDIIYNDLKTKGIVFGTTYGNVYCYELYSLEMVWENSLSETDQITGTCLANDKIIIQTNNENYYCLDSDNGVLIWKYKTKTKSKKENFNSDLISKGTTVYLTDSDGNLISLDLLLGTENWIRKRINASGKLFFINNELFVNTTKNEILMTNPKNGKTKNAINLPEDFQNFNPTCLFEDGKQILLGFGNGYICKLNDKKNLKEILYAGNSPVISLLKKKNNSYLSVNRNGKLIEFTIN